MLPGIQITFPDRYHGHAKVNHRKHQLSPRTIERELQAAAEVLQLDEDHSYQPINVLDHALYEEELAAAAEIVMWEKENEKRCDSPLGSKTVELQKPQICSSETLPLAGWSLL